mgnify:CR=1 FL=1
MLLKFVNFTLVFSVSLNLILIWLLLKQKSKTPLIYIFSAIVALFALDSIGVLYFLNPVIPDYSIILGQLHVIFAAWLLAGLCFFTSNFTYASHIPRLSISSIVVFATAGVLSVMALASYIVPDVHRFENMSIPVYSANFWLFIAYFFTITIFIFYEILRRRDMAAHPAELAAVGELLAFIAPLTVGFLMCIYILPFFWPEQPLLFSGYALLSLLLYVCATRYQLLEITGSNQHTLPQFTVAATFMLIFYFTPGESHTFSTVFLSIPLLIACTLVGQYILMLLTNNLKRVQPGYSETMGTNENVEHLSANIIKITERPQLWEHLSAFCKEIFDTCRFAAISLQQDVNPYHIDFVDNFTEEEIASLIDKNVTLLETLQREKQIVNKFNLAPESEEYDIMNHLKLYLAIPLLTENKLTDIILLGGDRQHAPFPQRNIEMLKSMSVQFAAAVENIRKIENRFQTEKIDGLAMLASQVAHDFRSFMALTKNYFSENARLKKHANYMENMVGDLLTYSRPQALKLTPVNIDQLIDMGLEGIEISDYVVLEKKYAPNAPKIPLDIHQMRRVFAGLIQNALRAMRMSEGEKIRITTRLEKTRTRLNRRQWLHIEIKDEGLGIPEEFMDRIFDPFFTTYKTEGSSGFGLAIIKQTITRHGGFIEINSEPGKYTPVNIRLPYQNSD